MNELLGYREKIDQIDHQLIELLAKRFDITQKVGEHKAKNQLPAQDVTRETAQYLKIEQLASQYGLDAKIAKEIIKVVIDNVVENHKKIADKVNS